MDIEKILENIKNKIYHPIYFLTGEEPYFIDKIRKTIEKTVLSDAEKEFNQATVYGRDVDIIQIISLAREYPVFGNYRVVIVREAQDLKELEKDERFKSYLKNPVKSTILVFDYKYSKIDGRTELSKLLDKNAVYFQSKKLYDNQIPDWIGRQIEMQGYSIGAKTRFILAENLGNDLSKIENEINKLVINLRKGSEITAEDIEKNIGISKDYNIFELQNALGRKDIYKANEIIRNFASNPKENPAIKIISMLFAYFKKIFLFHFLKDKSDNNVAAQLGTKPFFVKDFRVAASNYNTFKVREIIAILREYDQKAKGVESGTMEDGEILKEMVFKILH